MNLESNIQAFVREAVQDLYSFEADNSQIQIQKTKKEFAGDVTVVCFPFVKAARKSPEQVGQEIGAYLQQKQEMVTDFNVIKGFLNLSISTSFWIQMLNTMLEKQHYGFNKVVDNDLM